MKILTVLLVSLFILFTGCSKEEKAVEKKAEEAVEKKVEEPAKKAEEAVEKKVEEPAK